MKDCDGQSLDANYQVLLLDNMTGIVRLTKPEVWHEATIYQWLVGNYACDCNRHLFFERAAGGVPGYEFLCGEKRYTAIFAKLDSGEIIELDEWPK